MPLDFRTLQDSLRKQLLARIRAGELTGTQLAQATGFQQAHISNFLNRKRGLSLEAMDSVLRAAGIPFSELLPNAHSARCHSVRSAGDPAAFVSIPIVDENLFAATHVPNQPPADTITLALNLVQRMRSTSMDTPRPHWDRFIALRVKPDDIAAMSPRLGHGGIAVIDRHHNSPDSRSPSDPHLFLIHMAEAFVIRYVERCRYGLLARPQNPRVAVEVIHPDSGRDALASIIGRVCFLQVQP